MSIFIAVLIFSAIIIVHEVGHFAAARINGIMVEEFAIGMGPKLISKKFGETLWSIRLFPIGGFCKMLGEDEELKDPRAFNSKKVWRRITVILAGVFMNIVIALAITCIIVLFNGFAVPVIRDIAADSPAEQIGLLPGDRITRINGSKINIYQDVTFVMENVTGKEMDVSIIRNGQELTYSLIPQLAEREDGTQGYMIGFYRDIRTPVFGEGSEGFTQAGFFESLKTGFYTSIFYVKSTYVGLIRLVTMRLDIAQMSGPIGIVNMIGDNYTEAAEQGGGSLVIWTMLNFMAYLSANLAVVNLLPLPALDGGRLVFLIIEGVRRKPIDPNKEGIIHFAGFVLLMIFAVFIAYSDIVKLI